MAIPQSRPSPQRWFGLAYLLVFVAGIGFFLLSFFALGVLPGMRLARTMGVHGTAHIPDYTAAELRGRRVYVSLGCALCHTQQVRFLFADVRRWGPPTAAWETRYDYPQLWGTRRIGPDLARESGVRSDDWQLTHLYNPRWIVPDSVMPGFPWLFHGRPDRPTAAASDLLAYLHTLGRARQSGAGTGSVVDEGLDPVMQMEISSICAAPFIHPNQARIADAAPDLVNGVPPREQMLTRGRTLFAQNCAGCHGSNGDGNGPAAAGLSPRPADLRRQQFAVKELAHILWNGVPGSAMPAWRDFPVKDLASLAAYVQSFHTGAADTAQAPVDVLSRGAVVYAQNCLNCHGEQGKGDGPASIALLPRPADFTAARPDTALIIDALDNGVPGASMPPWRQLAPADRQAVSAFVRSLFKPAAGQQP